MNIKPVNTSMEVLKPRTTNNNSLKDEHVTKHPTQLICFSHLRWDFVYQRPQHLITRFSSQYKVFFVEEPYYDAAGEATITLHQRGDNLWLVVPHVPPSTSAEAAIVLQKNLFDKLLGDTNPANYLFWYYTPMAMAFTGHFDPAFVVYDCMDELSNFKFAPPELKQYEKDLLQKADVVFTGGRSLYEAKKNQHQNIFPFPSSIDKQHFEQARSIEQEPADQAAIPYPRLGFYGVIDERFDIDLIAGMAAAKPDWHFVLLGPVVKIDPATLPKLKNLHFLGSKTYDELPAYLSKWDVALIPFLLNEATRFISPTKTPEYLAAGVPVVSTPIKDVVYPYGEEGYVKIASDVNGFVEAAEELMTINKTSWIPLVDEFLSTQSWHLTYTEMLSKIHKTFLLK